MASKSNTIRDKILEGLKLTHLRLVQSKKDLNQELIISKDGKIVRVKADEL